MRWPQPPIDHRRRGPRSGQATASRRRLRRLRRPPAQRLPDPSRSSSARPGSNVKRGSEWLKTGIRPRHPSEGAARPRLGLLWSKLKQASKGEGPIINRPTRPPWRTAVDAKGVCNCPRGGTRRCTNEAVRATRPSELYGRTRPAEPSAFYSTRAVTPTRLGFALHGLALLGQDGGSGAWSIGALVPGCSMRYECELMSPDRSEL